MDVLLFTFQLETYYFQFLTNVVKSLAKIRTGDRVFYKEDKTEIDHLLCPIKLGNEVLTKVLLLLLPMSPQDSWPSLINLPMSHESQCQHMRLIDFQWPPSLRQILFSIKPRISVESGSFRSWVLWHLFIFDRCFHINLLRRRQCLDDWIQSFP